VYDDVTLVTYRYCGGATLIPFLTDTRLWGLSSGLDSLTTRLFSSSHTNNSYTTTAAR